MKRKCKERLCNITYWMLVVLVVILFAIFCTITTGCGHNTGAFMLGTDFNIGLDPQYAIPRISYMDGFFATDISRENSGWELEIDANNGLSIGKDGTVKGIKRMRRHIGPQLNGYFVKLVKDDPELARHYIEAVKYYWQYRALMAHGDSTATGRADSAISAH